MFLSIHFAYVDVTNPVIKERHCIAKVFRAWFPIPCDITPAPLLVMAL